MTSKFGIQSTTIRLKQDPQSSTPSTVEMMPPPPPPNLATLVAIQNRIRMLRPVGHMLQDRLHAEATRTEPDLQKLCTTANCLDELRAELQFLQTDLLTAQVALKYERRAQSQIPPPRYGTVREEPQGYWRETIEEVDSDDSDGDYDSDSDPYNDSDGEREDEGLPSVGHMDRGLVKRGSVIQVVPLNGLEAHVVQVGK